MLLANDYITTPLVDAGLQGILDYLYEGLNETYPGSVVQTAAVDRFPEDVSGYPHLCLFSTGATGAYLERRRGVVRYAIPWQDATRLPGQFRTLQRTIVLLLNRYFHPTELVKINPQQFECRNLLFSSAPNRLLSFFEIEFEFVDKTAHSCVPP